MQAMAREWLGPTMGHMTSEQVAKWAGRLRNDPDARIEFEETLRKHRLALFPGYENENLTYEDIISPVRNLATNIWGRPIMDNEAMLDKLFASFCIGK